MEEDVGFEPTAHLSMSDDLANRCLKPLSQSSRESKLLKNVWSFDHVDLLYHIFNLVNTKLKINFLAQVLGFEPRIQESKSCVLPLHYTWTET